MTVQELIDLLQTCEDKSLQIMYDDNEFGTTEINEVFLNNAHAWNNPNHPDEKYYTFQ